MSNMEYVHVNEDILESVSHGSYHAPHDVLGPHVHGDTVTIRAIRHLADEVYIETSDGRTPATHEHNGIWRAVLNTHDIPDYRVVAVYGGIEDRTDDPYRFLPTVGEMDVYLFSEGRHEELWRFLGAHTHTFESTLGDTSGTSFSVWAPNARAVRVIGDFNNWDGTAHAMRTLGESGVWEIFIPEALEGARYKYDIQYEDYSWHQKADPMARRTEMPPSTASIITTSTYEWNDSEWMEARAARNPHTAPISIYEVHLGSWRPGLNYRTLAEQLIGHVKYCGFTHVEFMPLAAHPYAPSWGYQVTGYYSPTARFGTPDDLRYLIDELHKAGIGVIMDWVPAHFPKDEWALARFDGTPLYEDPNPLRGEHPDWGTYVFNFGRREVRNFLVANASYWCQEFHVDAIRVDAVASMLYLDYSRSEGQWQPNVYGGRENLEAISFIQEATATTYRLNPGIMMIAEESTSWPGVTDITDNDGLGFGLKWNMGWMNDTLRYLEEKPINRKWHHNEITFSLVYAFSEHFLLPLSHDEVVHGKGSLYRKMPGDSWQKLAGVRELFAYQWAHPGKKLLFMGQEFAQIEEWSESRGLDWWLTDDPSHDGVLYLVKRLNELYREHSALWEEDFSNAGFEWIDTNDSDHNVISFIRKNSDASDVVAVVCNFSGIPFHNYRVGLPFEGTWREILNTDATEYGGSGVGNLGAVQAEAGEWNGRPYSALMQLPPFGVLYFVPENLSRSDEDNAESSETVNAGDTNDTTVLPVEAPTAASTEALTEAPTDNSEHDDVVVTVPADENPADAVDHDDVDNAPSAEEIRHGLLADIDGLNLDDPNLGMPGPLPLETDNHTTIGDYTIHEYDWTTTPTTPTNTATTVHKETPNTNKETPLPQKETKTAEEIRHGLLADIDGLNLDDPNLGMPGPLPLETDNHTTIGDYTIHEYDWTTTPTTPDSSQNKAEVTPANKPQAEHTRAPKPAAPRPIQPQPLTTPAPAQQVKATPKAQPVPATKPELQKPATPKAQSADENLPLTPDAFGIYRAKPTWVSKDKRKNQTPPAQSAPPSTPATPLNNTPARTLPPTQVMPVVPATPPAQTPQQVHNNRASAGQSGFSSAKAAQPDTPAQQSVPAASQYAPAAPVAPAAQQQNTDKQDSLRSIANSAADEFLQPPKSPILRLD